MRKFLAIAAILIAFSCPADAFKAVLTGDSRNDYKGILPAIAREAAKVPDLQAFVHTGDMTGAGGDAEYAKYRRAMSPVKVPILAVPGNHERKNFKNYHKYIGNPYGTRKIGSWRLLMLDNSRHKMGTEQLQWLKNVLQNSKKQQEHIVMVTHIPLFFTGNDRVMGGSDRKTLLKLIKDYKVKLVISGHIHGYCKVVKGGVTYLTTGGAGAPLYGKNSFHHYVLADFRDDGMFGLQVKKVKAAR